jgi:hypothetical protein
MLKFQERIKEYLRQDVLVKDVNGGSYNGILKEVGEDYCVLAIAKRALVYNLIHVVSLEPRMQTFGDAGADKTGGTADS